ncbi:6271_t:CDS:1 [Dentiscutata erythropus]|uniref:6271_t:CDS:1 n=1 Tax=Dentiscutata erythropus TaxID=1348616 RepID=A0A9N8YXR4_9GLOM|nr:6271_t:CDS:1 [Dentiscutata erythropus]
MKITLFDSSKWTQISNIANISIDNLPFLGGSANDKVFFATEASYGTSACVFIDSYDTTLNKRETNISFTGKPSKYFIFSVWTSNGSTGKSYSIQDISRCCRYF